MPTAAEPVHKGTLVCVVLKARNLPNKKSIGKQDPYTVLAMGQEQQKTKPDKRGGQHPTWDEQLHFEVYEDMEDALTANGSGSGSKATSSGSTKSKGGKKVLKVACYADDSREPELIGEGIVDLTETLKTGEFDEWVTIKAKDRYAGEVYLELTFYSSAAPPVKRKSVAKPTLSGGDTYGGAGTFQRIEEGLDSVSASGAPPKPPKGKGDHPPIPASMRPGGGAASNHSHNRLSSSISTSSLASSLHRPPSSMSQSQTMYDLGAGTLRPSSSLANLDAYTPAYAPTSISRGTSPAPPSSGYHPTAPSHASSMGHAAGNSRRNSFAAPMPSEFGHSITPSASYYSQHSMTPSQSNQYLNNNYPADAGDDRYATIRPGAIIQQQQPQPQQQQQYGVPRSHSISHVPSSYSHMPQPDYGADQLARSMSQMGLGTVSMDKPHHHQAPSYADERPPQSHIYQAPAHLASLYTPPPGSSYPAQPDASQQQHMQRPVSPAGRPGSALSHYSTSPAPAPSVVNAQAYYQSQQPQQPQHPGNHLAQPSSIPPRSSSPAAASPLPSGYTPIPSPYSQPAQQQHVPRPLPSTQSSTSLAAVAQSPSQHAYPSHLYQPAQQPSPPPAAPAPHAHQPQLGHRQSLSHSLSQSYSQNSWQGPPPPTSQPPQQSYVAAAPAPSTNGIPSSMSSGYIYSPPPSAGGANDGGSSWIPGRAPSPLPPVPGSQQPPQHLSASSSMHSFYGSSPAAGTPAPAPPISSHSYQHAPPPPPPQQQAYQSYPPSQQQHYASTQPQQQPPPPQAVYGQQYAPQPPQQYAPQQGYPQQTNGSGSGIPSSTSFSSSLLYQSHQNNQYQHQHQHHYQ